MCVKFNVVNRDFIDGASKFPCTQFNFEVRFFDTSSKKYQNWPRNAAKSGKSAVTCRKYSRTWDKVRNSFRAPSVNVRPKEKLYFATLKFTQTWQKWILRKGSRNIVIDLRFYCTIASIWWKSIVREFTACRFVESDFLFRWWRISSYLRAARERSRINSILGTHPEDEWSQVQPESCSFVTTGARRLRRRAPAQARGWTSSWLVLSSVGATR